MFICILGGIGTAGVPAGSIPVIAMILGMVGVPPEGIGIILGVDRFLDMCRTTVNVTGDLAAAVVVAAAKSATSADPRPAAVRITCPGRTRDRPALGREQPEARAEVAQGGADALLDDRVEKGIASAGSTVRRLCTAQASRWAVCSTRGPHISAPTRVPQSRRA